MNSNEIKQQYINCFEDLSHFEIIQHNVGGYHVELRGSSPEIFNIELLDSSDNIIYQSNISCGVFCKLNINYYDKWKYRLYKDTKIIKEDTLNLNQSRVYISFESKSLGDTIAWIPYCEEFRKKHNCEVIVSTFWNKFFESKYSELQFVEPGSIVHNIKAMYNLGWFYNKEKEPELPNTIPLQKTATNILGLNFYEIKPEIDFQIQNRIFKEKYVTIATHSTAGCKYWNNPNGWQNLINYLLSYGYKVLHVSKEPTDLIGVTQLKDTSIGNTMSAIHHSEFFIGLSSGLSWLSLALNKHVVMISNFTENDHEFVSNCTRITNKNVCNGCWNNPMFKFDKGDWNWCPEHKDTDKQFECHKQITSEMVIDKIQHLL